jgi:predicted phage terminase large subunit-like protein
LTDVYLGKIKRLVISLPPRSLKSIMTSVALPAWVLGHSPTRKIMCASYAQDLSDKFARDTRTVMTQRWYQATFPGTRIVGHAVGELRTSREGARLATSSGGVMTGRGADIIIIDDPLKPADALSEVARTNTNAWFDNTVVSRLDNKSAGAIIIIAQRLHQDDLIGHVLQQGGWEVLSFPAIAEVDEDVPIITPYGVRRLTRKAGEVLHPAREPTEELDRLRQSMGEYHFQAQYQQSPAPLGGAMIKTVWLRYYESGSLPSLSMIVQSWDTANKSGELNDYSVCTTWGVREGRYYLLHVFRRKLNFPDLKRAVGSQAAEWKPQTILIEDKASGTQLIQELVSEGVFGIKAYAPPPGTDKVLRLHAQATGFENGFVFLPREAHWLAEYVNELTSFPGAKYDDQVDSTTQALAHMRAGSSSLEVWAKLGREAGPFLAAQRTLLHR